MPALEPVFNLRPSRLQLFLLLILIMISEMIVLNITMTILFKLLLSLGIIIYGYYLWKRQYFIRSFQLRNFDTNEWVLNINNIKENYNGKLQKDSTVTSVICILRFRVEKRFFPITCIIFPDALSKEEYKRLLRMINVMSF